MLEGNRFDETLSREISQRNAARTIRGISPLRFASVEMTRGALANTVISSGDACRYGADGKRFDETLSREISQRNAARTIRGDFSTPQRFRRNDGGRAPFFIKLAAEPPPPPFEPFEPFEPSEPHIICLEGED